jgi:hypothetical protein
LGHTWAEAEAVQTGGSIVVKWCAGFLALAACSSPAVAHDDHNVSFLPCDATTGETCFLASIDDFHTTDSPHPNAIGTAHLVLNAARTQLRYQIEIQGLNLKPTAEDRTAPDDVIGVHLHLSVPDAIGPHVLNIFGLATYNTPAEEDADLTIDYAHHTLSGIYDNGDATIDPATGQPYLPFYPLTSKPLSDWIDNLENGDLMVAVHTNASGFPKMAIHGHIGQAVPEPATGFWFAYAPLSGLVPRRKRSWFQPGMDATTG